MAVKCDACGVDLSDTHTLLCGDAACPVAPLSRERRYLLPPFFAPEAKSPGPWPALSNAPHLDTSIGASIYQVPLCPDS